MLLAGCAIVVAPRWVGGVVPFGYGLEDRKFVVDEGEAATVQRMFERCRALGSLSAVRAELRKAEW